MKEYHKIHSIYKRDEKTKRFIEGAYSRPEFAYLANCEWDFSEKVDGTNIRIGLENRSRVVGGRTDAAQIPAKLVQRLDEILPKEKLESVFAVDEREVSVTLYGEGYGAGIQKIGKNYISDGVDFILFDIRVGDWWLKREDVEYVAKELGIHVVPVIGKGPLSLAEKMCQEGFKSRFGYFDAEGIVARPSVDLLARSRERIITKVKLRDYRHGGNDAEKENKTS